jgi:hypothetical protein
MGPNYFKSMGKWVLPYAALLGDINISKFSSPKKERASSYGGSNEYIE